MSRFEAGEKLAVKTSPFDTDIQVIDAIEELVISKKFYKLRPMKEL